MHIYPYDQNYNPPAPTSEIIVSSSLLRQLGEGDKIEIQISVILDTGADISFIPKKVIKSLETKIGKTLPYSMIEVEDYNGEKFKHKTYELKILPEKCEFGDEKKVVFLESNGTEGILGRDVLNQHAICLDGPRGHWTCERK